MSHICPKHSAELLSMIRRKGMGRYVTQSMADVQRKAKLWLQGTAQPQDFDPYIVATFEITKKARDEYGIQNGTCPLCFVAHVVAYGADDSWIDNVTDLMVITCQANDLRIG